MKNIKKTTKYSEFLKIWIVYHRQFIKKSTYASYATIIENHILKELGKYQISKINNNILQEYTLEKLKNGKLQGGGLSQKVVKDILVVIKLSLRYAMKKEFINSFDMHVVYPREIKDKKLKVFTEQEQKLITKHLLTNINSKNIGLLVCLYSGIRIGELCALQWEDIDITNKCLNIEKTLQRLYFKDSNGGTKTEVIITSPKTSSSIRTIPLPDFLLKELIKHNLKDNMFINTGTQKYTEPRTYRDYYKRLLKRIGIEFKNFHSLRHTFATRCIELDVDYKTVSDLMGHATVNTTLNLYVHSNFSQKQSAVNQLFDAYVT